MPFRLRNSLLQTDKNRFVLSERDTHWMAVALKAAERGGKRGEVPVGAVWVSGEEPFSAFNLREGRNDPTAHAEILAIREAAKSLFRWRLGGTLYVTLEPCAMCAGAILEARITRLVFGAWDPKAGACGSVHDLIGERKVRHAIEVVGGVCADRSTVLLTDFFKVRRFEKKGMLYCGEMAEFG